MKYYAIVFALFMIIGGLYLNNEGKATTHIRIKVGGIIFIVFGIIVLLGSLLS